MDENQRGDIVKSFLNEDEEMLETLKDLKWFHNFNFAFTLVVIIFLGLFNLWTQSNDKKEIISTLSAKIDTVGAKIDTLEKRLKLLSIKKDLKTTELYAEQCRVDSLQDEYMLRMQKEIDRLK
jgi:predicted negative regulator of RcsB-dependent stress response